METKTKKNEDESLTTLVIGGRKADIEKIGELAKKTERSRSGIIRLMIKFCLSNKTFLKKL